MLKTVNRIVSGWNKLIGSEDSFSMENRLYNVVCVLTLSLVFIFLLNSLVLHLWQSAFIAVVVMLLQFVFYYFARFKKRFNKSIILNAVVSYVALYFNFFVNSGSNGPTLFIFFSHLSFTYFNYAKQNTFGLDVLAYREYLRASFIRKNPS